ncbi:helix-turn-helix domain-containing protein [Micromonospora sp. NPDC005652]|uniref:helix-turn-helix domain-containing protein n=1 Tax=Micromonospora sp. NPDC005652 TaxID=3157046 RepID=UPI0033F640E2
MTMTREEKQLVAQTWQQLIDGTAKAIVRAADITLDDVAQRVGVKESTVWRWLDGQQPRGPASLRFARLLEELLPTALANIEEELQAAEDRIVRAENYRQAVLKLAALARQTKALNQAA